MSVTLYEKRGRRYVPVAEYDTQPYWGAGYWLVHVKPGIKTTKQLLDPAFAEVEAALQVAADAMVKAIEEESVKKVPAYCSSDVVLKNHEKAWAVYREAMGDEYTHILKESSPRSIVEAAIEVLRKLLAERGVSRDPEENQSF